MKQCNIYDEHALGRQLRLQRRLTWDLETKIDWSLGVDLHKPLLPLDADNILFPQADAEQRLVISQLMGLIVASTISQLEQTAAALKGPAWENVLDRYPVNPEFRELGEQFYAEEAKHSVAFDRYISLFSQALGVDPDDFKAFLPQSDRSLSKKVYELNSLAGGMAMWWLIAAVEEESVMIYHHAHAVKDRVDPLYYQLHRAHYEEESRHKSYALMMLNLFEEFCGVAGHLVFKKVDFILAECLNVGWTLNQIIKVRGLERFENHHPFFKVLKGLLGILGERNPIGLTQQLVMSAPYISDNLYLGEYEHVKELLHRFGAVRLPAAMRPGKVAVCIA